MKKKLLFIMLMVLLLPLIPKNNELFSTDSRIKWKKDSVGIYIFNIHPNGNIIGYSYPEDNLLELNPNNGDTIRVYNDFYANSSNPFVISSDGNYIINLTGDTLKILNYQTQEIKKKKKTIFCYSILFDSRRLIVDETGIGQTIYDFLIDSTYIFGTTNQTWNVAGSPYGPRYITVEKNFDANLQKQMTHLILKNSNNNEIINELETYERNVSYYDIQFSPDNKYIGFKTNEFLFKIFSLDSFKLVKEFNNSSFPTNGFSDYCFIDSTHFAYSSSSASFDFIANIHYDTSYVQVRNIFTDQILLDYRVLFADYTGLAYCPNNKTLISRLGKDLYGFNWDSILSDVPEPLMIQSHSTEFNKNTLQINGTFDTSQPIEIIISDINGNLVKKQNIQNFESGTMIKIPMYLPTGVYFVRIKNGKVVFTDKFIVVK